MIKKITLFFLTAVSCLFTANADETKKIVLNNDDHSKETIEFGYGILTISLGNIDDDNATLTLNLENTDNIKTLFIFDQAYDEKSLKRLIPSIKFDKVFIGKKGDRHIDCCTDIKEPEEIRPNEKKDIQLKKPIDNIISCQLPIYIARNKGNNMNKFLLMNSFVLSLEISIENKPDEEYISLTEDCNNFLSDISRTTFCKNGRHKGSSYSQLVDNYNSKRNNLEKRIDRIIEDHNYRTSDKNYKELIYLKHRIADVDFDNIAVSNCNNDKVYVSHVPYKGHSCSYCNSSYDELFRKVETYKLQIHNGKKSKNQVIGDINAISTCLQKCKKRSGNSGLKGRINTYINKIKAM